MKHNEARLQIACVKWFDLSYPKEKNRLFSIPNEGARSVANGARMKAMGRRAGMPDMCLLAKDTAYFFEFKDTKGRLSKPQVEMHAALTSYGYPVAVIYDFDSFVFFVQKVMI